MKIFRLVDTNGYFIEDVVLDSEIEVLKEAVMDGVEEITPAETELVYSIDEFHIDGDIPQGMIKPRWDFANKIWIDELASQAEINTLNYAKERKKDEIKALKKQEQLMPVEVRSVMFYGGREAGQKYDESLRLAQKMNAIQGSGLVTGTFWDANNNPIKVDEAYANEVIIAVAGAVYQMAAKEKALITQINNATTVAEVEGITW